MAIKKPKNIQMDEKLYDDVKSLAEVVREDFKLPRVSQATMIRLMYEDYVSHRKVKAKRDKRNGL